MHSPDTFIQSNSCCVQGMNVVTFELFPVVAVWCDPVFGWLCKLLLFCLLGNMWTSYCPSEATRYLHISLIRYFSYFQLLLEPLKSDLLHLWISVWCFSFSLPVTNTHVSRAELRQCNLTATPLGPPILSSQCYNHKCWCLCLNNVLTTPKHTHTHTHTHLWCTQTPTHTRT